MKVYLAAAFSRKDEIAEKTHELQALGVEVTSTWPWESAPSNVQLNDVTHEYRKHFAQLDIDQIDAADALILFTFEPTTMFVRGGRMHEMGYAHGKGKRLYICGPRENIFHELGVFNVFPSWGELKQHLAITQEAESRVGI